MHPDRHTWRVQGIPRDFDRETLTNHLRQHPKLQVSDQFPRYSEWEQSNGAIVETLALDHRSEFKVATIVFGCIPLALVNSHSLKVIIQQELESCTGQKRSRDTQIIEITLDDLFEGITVLVSPATGRHHVDVLALSGLGSHPFGSFVNKEDGHMWLKDRLPRDFPGARVLIYGYDTKLRHSNSFASIETLGSSFESSLGLLLQSNHEKSFVLIGHSLGGLLVKEALLRLDRNCPELLCLISGVLLFGVPNDGMDIDGFRKLVEGQPNQILLNSIALRNSTRLEQNRRFIQLLERSQLKAYCWSETKLSSTPIQTNGRYTMGGPTICLVSEASATSCLPESQRSTHVYYMDRSHSELMKFRCHDPTYDSVARVLSIVVPVAPVFNSFETFPSRNPPALRAPSFNLIAIEERKLLRASLRFDDIDSRELSIKKAYIKTCRWLLKLTEFQQWRDPAKLCDHHGFLWIRGKPGAGKSTLMKFAFQDAQKRMKDTNIISFFFNARGADLEKSVTGMYRSLLFQLLEADIKIKKTAFLARVLSVNLSQHEWSTVSLKSLFEEVVSNLGPQSLTCFIDALDECKQEEVRDMVSAFEDLCKDTVFNNPETRLFICFSSRHYPHITISHGRSFILERQLGHSNDINIYVDDKLMIGNGVVAQRIKENLQTKAAGVFMWVVLVVDILNQEFSDGCNDRKNLEKRLEAIPKDLHDLFRDILTRDSRKMQELLLCLQLILFQKRPLRPEEVYFAIRPEIEPGFTLEWNPDDISHDDICRYINCCSKGLLEITRSKVPTVQFIHESVRDFLIHDQGIKEIYPETQITSGESHNKLKHCCLRYMCVDLSTYVDLSKDLPHAASRTAWSYRKSIWSRYPFLDYSVQNVIYHADMAEGCGITQAEFLRSFNLTTWITLANILEGHEVRRHTPSTSFLYTLAEQNCSNLIKISTSRLSYLDIENERYGTPLFAALALGNSGAVRTFLEAEMANQPSESSFHEILERCLNKMDSWRTLGRDFKLSKDKDILSSILPHGCTELSALVVEKYKLNESGTTSLRIAVENAANDVVEFLLNTGKFDMNARNKYGETLLISACKRNLFQSARLLVRTGQVSMDAKDHHGRTALMYAAAQTGVETVKLLLGTEKVDIDARDYKGRTALMYAATRSCVETVKLLLDTGKTDIDAKDHKNRTALIYATAQSRIETVKLLLGTEKVDIDARDYKGRTALMYAATRSCVETVKLLLDTGKVDIDAKDYMGRTPLFLALSPLWTITPSLRQIDTDKVDGNSKDYDDRTRYSPEISSVWSQWRTGAIKLLLNTGKVNVNAKDHQGYTPLIYAESCGRADIVKLMLQ